jgi:hypothetical protein
VPRSRAGTREAVNGSLLRLVRRPRRNRSFPETFTSAAAFDRRRTGFHLERASRPPSRPNTNANQEPPAMDVHLDIALLQPVIALIAGVLILVVPRLLNYVVALYLILLGVSGLWPHLLH